MNGLHNEQYHLCGWHQWFVPCLSWKDSTHPDAATACQNDILLLACLQLVAQLSPLCTQQPDSTPVRRPQQPSICWILKKLDNTSWKWHFRNCKKKKMSNKPVVGKAKHECNNVAHTRTHGRQLTTPYTSIDVVFHLDLKSYNFLQRL